MDKKSKWSQFLIGVLGTAIGVALTFGLNGMVERQKRAQAQRLTAIMVIHDIDNTIDLFKSWKQQEEKGEKILRCAMDNREHLDKLSPDTLAQIVEHLVENGSEFHFDTSKESIFNSGLDTWQNLGNMKFIDNVQRFYYDRRSVQDAINISEVWRSPIPRDEYLQLRMDSGLMTMEQFGDIARVLLKKKLYDKQVLFYADLATYRVQTISNFIDSWARMNEENKFLIGITDREMEDYVNRIDVSGIAVRKRTLKGTWTLSKEQQHKKYSFDADHSFSIEVRDTETGHWRSFYGDYTSTLSYTGTWDIKGDSLILKANPQSFVFELDGSGLVPEKGRKDSLDSWLKSYPEEAMKYYNELTEEQLRTAFKASLDPSRDKMEWVNSEGDAIYLKRDK